MFIIKLSFLILCLFVSSHSAFSVDDPANFAATPVSSTEISLTWALNPNSDSVIIAFDTINSFGIPADGTPYLISEILTGGGTFIYKSNGTIFNHTGLLPNKMYYYKIWSFSAGNIYSVGVVDSVKTMCQKIIPHYYEGFENGGLIPECWTQEYVNGMQNWVFTYGNSYTNNPSSPYSGQYCAVLGGANKRTKLVLPVMDLSADTDTVLLSFWGVSPFIGSIKVYYKTSTAGAWVSNYSSPSIPTWANYTIAMPYPSGEYYIAIEGTTLANGIGPAIDSVYICGGVLGCCNLPPAPVISGPFSTCIGFGYCYYSVPNDGSDYYWSVSDGADYSYSGNNLTITEFPDIGIYTITVTRLNQICPCSSTSTYTVCVSVGNFIISSITGNFTPCIGSTQTYSLNITEAPSCGFSWNYPIGYTLINQDQTSTTAYITLQIGSNSGNISVQGACGYCAFLCPTNVINSIISPVNIPSQPSAITGSLSPCQNSTQTYSVTNVTGVIQLL